MVDSEVPSLPKLTKLCGNCDKNASLVYCECAEERIYLCGACTGVHVGKYQMLRHELIPAAAEVANMPAYRDRGRAFIAAKQELEQNIKYIDQCCKDLSDSVQGAIEALKEYLDSQLSQLRELKATLSADISKSVSEAEAALALDVGEFTGKYTHFLRKYEKDSLVLFAYKIRPDLADLCLQEMPSFRLMSPGQYRNPLLRLRKDQVEMFSFLTDKWGPPTRLKKAIRVDEYSMYTRVDAHSVFCCGSFPASAECMSQTGNLLNSVTGSVEELPPLRVERAAPGLLYHEGGLFVFGSATRPGREVEMLQLNEKQWTPLPDMSTQRCYFSPCEHSGNAYLCWGNDKSVDVLKLSTRTFIDPVLINIPDGKYSNAVTFVSGDELIVITRTHTATNNLVRSAPDSKVHAEFNIGPLSNPVKHGNRVYWVNNEFKLVRASGDKYEILEYVGN